MNYKLINNWTNHTEMFSTLADVLWHLNRGQRRGENPYMVNDQFQSLEVWRGDVEWYPVVQRRDTLCIALSGAGSAQDLLARMLDEVMPYALKDDGTVRKPFEMTPSQWGAITGIASIAYGVYRCLSTQQEAVRIPLRDGTSGGPEEFIRQEFIARFGYGHNGPAYGNGGDINSRHELHVGYALLRGDRVPEAVLDGMKIEMEHRGSYEGWIVELIEKQYLRGLFTSRGVMMTTTRLLRSEGIELTAENCWRFANLVKHLSEEESWLGVDDALYEAGYLKDRSIPPATPGGEQTPINTFAARVHEEVVGSMKRRALNKLEAASHRMTRRDRNYERAMIERTALDFGFSLPNRLSRAVDAKDLSFLLELLNQTGNNASKRAVEKEFGVKLCNQPEKKRKRVIYGLAGFKAEAEFVEEAARRDTLRNARMEAKRAQRLRATAEAAKVKFEGEVIDGASFVDKLIERGHTLIVEIPNGASKRTYLKNPATNLIYLVTKKSGLFDYAKEALARMPTEAKEAATA